mgnify:CR=1 FL=1
MTSSSLISRFRLQNADRAALNKEFAGYHSQLAAAADPTEVVRKSASTVAYLGIPVSKDAFPRDIAAQLDSMAVGSTSAVKLTPVTIH